MKLVTFVRKPISTGPGNIYSEYGKWLCRGPVLAIACRYSWVTLSPGDIIVNMENWPFRLGVGPGNENLSL